ncbi:DUF1707 SHOCT-like domain-containing protein [Amycolatopsis methanolica]|uniref:DUF1707 domain-containing protein n=1 Tax=Amycolatopsis methanolica 239 TaxID=1068978 RepID=A0A076MJD3_AMYME|nr:DUF1707 domain-containing protein [Amycolatopsis methanolica]AIJ20958.1 hypothetical protein AMETH_0866 [Amycolatopsis methanolica 239]
MSDEADLRLSDAERTEAMDALSEHVRTGRLDIDEFGRRSAQVAAARTRSDLAPLFADLPAPRPRVLDRPVPARPPARKVGLGLLPLLVIAAVAAFVLTRGMWVVLLVPVVMAVVLSWRR